MGFQTCFLQYRIILRLTFKFVRYRFNTKLFYRIPRNVNQSDISCFPFDFDGNFLIFWDPQPHRIVILGMNQILDRGVSQEDLLNGSKTMNLNPDLPEAPALLLLNQESRISEKNPNQNSGGISFVSYHGGHLCKFEISP